MNRIQYFSWVRDIPYSIPTTPEDQDYCCEGKHKILEKLLKSTGLEVRPRVCETRWSDFLPDEILTIPHTDDIVHLYLEVRIDKWYTIDASLDSGLASVFPVNQWDGKSSTPLCVKPLKTYSPKKSLEWFHTESDYEEDLITNGKFYAAINNWLESIRSTTFINHLH